MVVLASNLKKGKSPYQVNKARRKLGQEGRVVQKPVNTNPGSNANRSIHFCCVKVFFSAYVSCGSRLPKLKTEGQMI